MIANDAGLGVRNAGVGLRYCRTDVEMVPNAGETRPNYPGVVRDCAWKNAGVSARRLGASSSRAGEIFEQSRLGRKWRRSGRESGSKGRCVAPVRPGTVPNGEWQRAGRMVRGADRSIARLEKCCPTVTAHQLPAPDSASSPERRNSRHSSRRATMT